MVKMTESPCETVMAKCVMIPIEIEVMAVGGNSRSKLANSVGDSQNSYVIVDLIHWTDIVD